MKTQNTLENKSRFFAKYWGQKIIRETAYPNSPLCKISSTFIDDADKWHAELTSLEHISDEDAAAAALYLVRVIGLDGVIQNANGNVVKEAISNYSRVGLLGQLPSSCIDFLRSKGYILPWLDLSVDDLIKYGWIKLKTT